jgi:tetratricopeptide (TPR) repeat protein
MICSAKRLAWLLLGIAWALPTAAKGQAILVEAYLEGAEAAIGESDVKKAARLCAVALTEARSQSNPELTARSLLVTANVHIHLGQFSEAQANVRAALEIYEQMTEADPSAILSGLQSLAAIHYFQKQYEDSEVLYAKVIKELRATPNHDGV